jgi:hypothetical protein
MAQLHETPGTAGTEPPAEAAAGLAEGLRQQAELAENLRQGRWDAVLADPEPWAAIEALGDSSVPVTYYGWLDQRRSKFALVRSEAIRRVKAALEAAGIELPEPTYRVRMEPQERPVREEPTSPPAAPADLGAPDAIDRQIAEERADARNEEDLLRPEAAKE